MFSVAGDPAVDAPPFIPTKQQMRFVHVFLSPDGPDTITGCAKLASVNRRTVYDWLEDRQFRQWFHEQCNRQGAAERELMWRNARKLAIAGSPEHIKLVAMKAGELIQPGTNDHARFPGSPAVFINVPRPRLLDPGTPDPPEPAGARELVAVDAQVVTELAQPGTERSE